MLGACVAGAADGAASHALNAYMEDADPTVAGAVRDGGIGCAIGLLTLGIGAAIKRARNAIGNRGQTPNGDGPGTRPDGDDGTPPRDGDDPACTGSQCGVPCATNSFPTGTQVRMGNGTLKPIEDIEPGDYVLAHDLETGQWRPQIVLDQWSHLDDGHMATVTIEDGTSVTATDHHQFWNETDQAWTELDQIEPGDMLLTPTGPAEVADLVVAPETKTLVWELTVEIDHNFTVSTSSADLLVHNVDPDCLFGPFKKSDLLESAQKPDRNGLTSAGRALQKHSSRDGSVFEGMSTGSAATRNQQGLGVVDDILSDPNARTEVLDRVINVWDSSGRGVRYRLSDGSFMGFLEPVS